MAKVSKSAIQLASDLEEIQNVVDVSFGEASAEVESFAKTCITQFGLGELSAKRFASQFMAMSNSMGVARSEGKNMALTLTGLAGDMASFYNVEQDIAKTALDSVFTGETESLKKFGIVLTEANLKAHALEKGITKSYSAMSQAEKVALRYSYVLKATAQVQGDFVRTSNTWANQVRILKEQWSQLLTILGRGLVTVLRPVVVVLNQMLASLIAVANAIAKAFGGSGISSSTGQVEDLNASIGDTGTGFEDANTEAKKLAKTIAGFDELEILASNPNNSNSSSGLGGDISAGIQGSGTVIDGPEVENPAEKFKKYLEECKKIIDKWISQIPKLQFEFDKEKAIADLGNIGKNLLNIIAGWGSFIITVGITLANDLNIGQLTNDIIGFIESATNLASKITDAVIPAIKEFYEHSGLKELVQWIGERLSLSINNASDILDDWARWFEENKENIKTFGEELGKAVEPLTNIVKEILKVSWDALGKALVTINGALRGIADSLIAMKADELQRAFMLITAIASTIGATIGIGKGLANLWGIDDWTKIFTDLRLTIGTLDDEILDGLLLPLESFASNFENPIKKLRDAFRGKFLDADMVFGTPLQQAQNMTTNMVDSVVSAFTSLPGKIGQGLSNFGTSIISTFGNIKTSISTAIGTLATSIGENGVLGTALNGIKGVFSKLWLVIKANPFMAIVTIIGLVVASIVTLYKNSEEFRDFVNGLWNDTLKPMISEIGANLKELWENHLKPLWENQLQPLLLQLGELIKSVWNIISTVIGWIVGILGGIFLTTFTTVFGSVLNTVIDVIGSISDIIGGLIDFITGVFTGDWKKAWEGVKDIIGGIFNGMIALVKLPLNTIIKLVNSMLSKLGNKLNGVIDWINQLAQKASNVPGLGWVGNLNINRINIPQIPLLANGGIITTPTIAMMGEYPGASNNPEIVTPSNLLREIVAEGNGEMVNAFYQIAKEIITAIDNVDMDVRIGDDVIAHSAKRGNDGYKRRTGKPLFV